MVRRWVRRPLTPIYRNQMGSALSGGLAGAGLAGMGGFNPLIGGALGAGAGLLGA
jgi:hypothetical protein